MKTILGCILVAILLCSPGLAIEADLSGDANIYNSVIFSLKQLEIQRSRPDDVIQKASSVCYDELGCFDKEGTFKHLKQLPEPPEVVNAQFLLYTRKNRLVPQMLDYKKPDTLLKSNLDGKLPLKVITHGFGGRNNLTWVWKLKNALLEKFDINVVVVDWSLGARLPYYIQAAVNSELVGAEVAVLYKYIKKHFGIQEKDIHMIGFSLGAHVMGFVGKKMKELYGTQPGRTTGLDPASPLFEDYGGSVHLYKDDADFVDVIHTNADLLLYGGVGIGIAIGHVDFYPNGGKRQPGCRSTLGGALQDLFKNDKEHACNHERAVHLYVDSILLPERCRFVGYRCGNYSNFQSAECLDCLEGCGHMGYHVEGEGVYYLMTKAETPYCTDVMKLSVKFATDIKRSYGRIILTLIGPEGAKQNITLTEKDEKLTPGDERVVAITLDEGFSSLKGIDVLYKKYNGWFTKGTDTFGLDLVTIQDSKKNYIFKSCEETTMFDDRQYKSLPTC